MMRRMGVAVRRGMGVTVMRVGVVVIFIMMAMPKMSLIFAVVTFCTAMCVGMTECQNPNHIYNQPCD